MKIFLTTIFINIFITHNYNIDIPKEHLLGKVNPEKDSNFVKVPPKYCLYNTEYINKNVLEDYIKMYNAALEEENIQLKIISAFRSFETQKWLWERDIQDNNIEDIKVKLKYRSMPGTSRHHWGTDIDLYSINIKDFESESGKKVYNWLSKNAKKYGFYQPYTKNRKIGYNEEKWHWSHLTTANEYLNQYAKKISPEDITGFKASKFVKDLKIIESYVLGLDSVFLTQDNFRI